MGRAEQKRLAGKVAGLWLKRKSMPSTVPFHLPRGLVSALCLGDVVRGMNGLLYKVTAVGPGALMLEAEVETREYTNQGYGDYAWAFFAAPEIHWLLTS